MHQLDLYLFHAVNGWAGNWALDRLVNFEESGELFRGGLMLIPFWWFWFAGEGERRETRRRAIVAALIGTFAALVAARVLATALPYRLRPMHVPDIGFRSPSLPIIANAESWSSFPSDTAALFFALSYGILRLSRPLGAIAMLYSAVWICLPRIYLGVHYPSDIAAGTLLGLGIAWAAGAALEARGSALGRRIIAPLSALEARRPEIFYSAFFVLSFEIATMFDDIRAIGHRAASLLHNSAVHLSLVDLAAAAILLVVVALAGVALRQRRHPRRIRDGLTP